MRAVSDSERGFTIIEVLVAVVVIAIGLVGVAALASSSSQSTSIAKVRDQQSSIAQSVADKIRGDSSWTGTKTETCSTIKSSPSINVSTSTWLNQQLKTELGADAISSEKWKVQAVARKVDSAADGTCSSASGDRDGVVPDYYELDVVVSPDASTMKRFPQLTPFATTFQVNFANRAAGGRLTIQACYVTPQVDERLPIGTCSQGPGDKLAVLPPPGSEVTPSAGDDTMTCMANPLDCVAYRCANNKLDDACPSGTYGDPYFVNVEPRPGTGWSFTLKGDPSDPVTKGYYLQDKLKTGGEFNVSYLKPGRYHVKINHSGTVVPWESHSVPADGMATVVSGVESRVIQMFKPAPRNDTLSIPIQTTDVTKPPWMGHTVHDLLYKKGPLKLQLVPIPRGRTLATSNAVDVPMGAATVDLTKLEPGLYGAYLSDPKLVSEYTLSGSKQFIFIPPVGQPILYPTSSDLMWKTTYCDPIVRKAIVNSMGGEGEKTHTSVSPTTGIAYTETWDAKYCDAPTGSPPPVGVGGGGGA